MILKALLILAIIGLVLGYLGYRALRFLDRLSQVAREIHEEGQRRGPIGNAARPDSRHSGEKDVTSRSRIVE